MRISDCSSDVCSSDLPAVDAVVIKRELLVVDAQQVQDGRVEVVAGRCVLHRLPRPFIPLPQRDPGFDSRAGEDRKSVVLAKRVKGRVTLGGRSSIIKTT